MEASCIEIYRSLQFIEPSLEKQSKILKKATVLSHFGETSTFVHPQIDNYCRALRRDYFVNVMTIMKEKFVGRSSGRMVHGYRKIGGLNDEFSVRMMIDMIRDTSEIVIIHGVRHLITLFGLLVYGLRGRAVVVVNTGLYDMAKEKNPICLIRDFIIFHLILETKSMIINQSDTDRQTLETKFHIDDKRNVYLPIWESSERVERARLSSMSKKSSNSFTILFCGRLEPGKKVDELIRAFAQLDRETQKECRLIIVGEGENLQTLRKLTIDLGVSSSVRFEGRVAYNEIWKFYHESDVVVLPTVTEACPRTIIEAMLAGRPVIASRIPQILELVTDSENGFTFETESELRDYILYLKKHPEVLVYMKENSKERGESYTERVRAPSFLMNVQKLSGNS